MTFTIEETPSDSPFIERIWHGRSEQAGSFISIAAINWEMVVTKYRGKLTFTVRGPETKPTLIGDYPAEMEWFGIDFKPGTFMPLLPPAKLIDFQDVNLPDASSKSFWLNGSAWQYPNYENADTFVERLVRDDLLVQDCVVEEVLQHRPQALSPRSIQYRFLRATGLTHRTIQQIERARYATACLKQGMSILDVVHAAGYFDQPHLTRALKRYIGLTPTEVMDVQLSKLSSLSPTEAIAL
jgi:AraC-like DNA-binding protein